MIGVGLYASKISKIGGRNYSDFARNFSVLIRLPWWKVTSIYIYDFKRLFLLSLLLHVLVRVVSILEVITILGYCPLLSSRGPA
jgi:hypothetical protein